MDQTNSIYQSLTSQTLAPISINTWKRSISALNNDWPLDKVQSAIETCWSPQDESDELTKNIELINRTISIYNKKVDSTAELIRHYCPLFAEKLAGLYTFFFMIHPIEMPLDQLKKQIDHASGHSYKPSAHFKSLYESLPEEAKNDPHCFFIECPIYTQKVMENLGYLSRKNDKTRFHIILTDAYTSISGVKKGARNVLLLTPRNENGFILEGEISNKGNVNFSSAKYEDFKSLMTELKEKDVGLASKETPSPRPSFSDNGKEQDIAEFDDLEAFRKKFPNIDEPKVIWTYKDHSYLIVTEDNAYSLDPSEIDKYVLKFGGSEKEGYIDELIEFVKTQEARNKSSWDDVETDYS
jgi:hypothetical protein